MITFDDFKKIEIRVGKVLSAEKIEGADKLLKLEIDLGGEKRQIVAGIALQFGPEELIGKEVPIVANLEPKELRGNLSHGMILVSVDTEGKVTLLRPENEVPPGSVVR
jgi:methionine--tRNA ligase beta chain